MRTLYHLWLSPFCRKVRIALLEKKIEFQMRVENVWELEQFGAGEIIEKLTHPVVQTVERIRHKLAEYNRYLTGDESYARRLKAAQARG